MTPFLERALEIVAEKDAGSFRQAVFADLARQRVSVRVARALHRLLGRSPLATALVAAYGTKAFLAVGRAPDSGKIVALALYPNEMRQIRRIDALLGGGAVAQVDLSSRALLGVEAWRALGSLPLGQLIEIVRRYDRGDFLVACRVASTAGYYFRLRDVLARSDARAVLTSSDSNPYAMALVAAARELEIPAAYVAHGHIPEGPPRLWYDLSILDGRATRDVYERSQGYDGKVVFRGAEGESRPMDLGALDSGRPLRIGIFASLIVDWERFAGILGQVQKALAPAHVLVRLHPNQVIRDRRAKQWIGSWDNLEVSDGENVLVGDAARCDLVLAGNTSAHLSVLKFGVPSVYVPGLDIVPHDFYGLLAGRVVPEVATIEALSPAKLAAFFREPDWASRFAEYDASHGRDPAELDAEVVAAFRELIGGVN
jgi:hypothetical protein